MKNLKMNFKSCALLLLVFSVFITSCDDESLTEAPTNFASPGQLLQDEVGAEIYLAGAYDAIQNLIGAGGGGSQGYGNHWGTMATDEVVVPGWGADRKIIFLQQVTASNVTVGKLWQELYTAVNQSNSVIGRVGLMTDDQIDAAAKNRIVAEAKFIRAICYFSLVTAWENVPLVTEETSSLDPESIHIPQSSPELVYEQIVKDLIDAKSVLETKQGDGRATKGAAQALLGKVYLQMTGPPLNQTDKFALAATELKGVMDSGVYSLLPVYADVFKIEFEQSSEIVFAAGLDGPGLEEGGNLSTFYGPTGNVNKGGGWGTCFANHEFALSYEKNDLRLVNNIAVHNVNNLPNEQAVLVDPNTAGSWANPAPNWRGWKHHAVGQNGSDYSPNDNAFDHIYIRYADVLLMLAEAKNGAGTLTQTDLDQTVNAIRVRTRRVPTAVADMVLGSKEDNATELLAERRRELGLEGWRRDDLIRFGKYKETILGIVQNVWSSAGNPGPNYEDHEIRWPIPEAELVLNPNLVQNPGYN